MLLRDFLHLTGSSLIAHRMRSFLTMLGIAVGITAVVLLTSIGEGIHKFVLAEFMDVVEKEPLRPDNPLFQFPNVILTPHTAFHSVESLQEVLRKAAEEVARVLQGQWPRSLVNPDVKDRISLRD